jgi:hypothetical protein
MRKLARGLGHELVLYTHPIFIFSRPSYLVVMDIDGPFKEDKPTVGPITEAYLHRDVHPDEKAGHTVHKTEHIFPKSEGTPAPNVEEIWMYI